MSTVTGKVAVVTGAGSGIGRSLASELARRGARLALSDIDGTGLAETAAQVTSLGAEVHIARLDVSDRTAVESYATTVAEHFGAVHRVYNNAGIGGGGGTVLETDWSAYERTIAISLLGVVHGTKAFLPHLIASGDGHVSTSPASTGSWRSPRSAPTAPPSSGCADSPRRCARRCSRGAIPYGSVSCTPAGSGPTPPSAARHSPCRAADAG
ncbi:NADP-dependent 3-hydroxy acid dehydrogenase YdfG [Streptomyces sp. DconLS]|nr:NADP-dependent 3-hydroxy acid dehydrogenase YdfG [Streptomyces sp. DconLS]SCF91213.1 NADP-dependent 3-hydroxy acid dehydrogenase YdfG [Streptomyces sp. LamerLS-31b]